MVSEIQFQSTWIELEAKFNLIQSDCHTIVLYLSIIWMMYEILFSNLFIRFLQHRGSCPTSTTSSKLCHAKLNPSEQNWSTGGLRMCLGLDKFLSWFASQIRCFLWYIIISCYDRCFLNNILQVMTPCQNWIRWNRTWKVDCIGTENAFGWYPCSLYLYAFSFTSFSTTSCML